MLSEVTVPKFAEGAVSITLKQWLFKKGDRVEEGRRMKVGQVIALLSSEPPEEK